MSDRDDICELVARFADAVNRLDAAQFAAVWAPHASWIIDPPTDYVSKGPRAEVAGAWREAMVGNWKSFVQLVQGTVVDVNGDTATSRSYITELAIPLEGEHGYYNHGTYIDGLERTDEGWRFTERRYRYLYLDPSPIAGTGAPLGGVF